MGYRSNASICCFEKAFEKFKEAYEKHNYKPDDVEEISEGVYILTWEWTKWYEEFDNVIAINDVMNELTEDEFNNKKEYAFKFIRVGEDDEDVEVEANRSGSVIFESFYSYTMVNFPDAEEIARDTSYWEKGVI